MKEGEREGRSQNDPVFPQCRALPWCGEAGTIAMTPRLNVREESPKRMWREGRMLQESRRLATWHP